jgi:type VI secretion system protein ImpG
MQQKVDWAKSGIDKVAIYLDAESPVASALHLAMTRRVHAMYVRHAATRTERISLMAGANPWALKTMSVCGRKPIRPSAATSCCWSISASVRSLCSWSYAVWTPSGSLGTATWFEIDIVLSGGWSSDLPFETENFRLHCAPVINLFTLEADPLTLNPLENEYLLARCASGRAHRNLQRR